ncbi:MAG: hypothetical protein HFH73_09915 [Lachnospiraceae bacterium]|jgi:hypothetical protein|nr:hypothetical protein [Lachnospiraceae bacterium]
MKRAYAKPIALANEDFMEGVYMTSGDTTGSDCFTVTANIHQKPETGREDYRIQVNAQHAAGDKHHSANQILTLSFNQPVHFSFCNGSGAKLKSGDGTSTLRIAFDYHQNGNDNIGLGDVVVTSEAGLAVTGAMMECDHQCAYNHPIH